MAACCTDCRKHEEIHDGWGKALDQLVAVKEMQTGDCVLLEMWFYLLSCDPDEQGSSIVAEIISLENAILALTMGRLPNRPWVRLSPGPAFVEKLRILIEDLTTPTDGRVPPFLRIVDADPKWRRYLFGRQRPDTRVEEMSWYWRFLLMMTLLRQLTWTRKFKESELSTI